MLKGDSKKNHFNPADAKSALDAEDIEACKEKVR
jgi:hypothetical protein